jgi:hypothetical protein
MTPRISLITAVFAAALAVFVPAALGDDWGADRASQTTFVGSPDLVDRAVAVQQARVASMLDARERSSTAGRDELGVPMLEARERAFGTKREVQLTTGVYPDVFERAVVARGTGGSTLDRFIANDNRHHVKPTNPPTTVSATSSGVELEWPQIGIAFGVGIALALGLMLALRATRQPPLAH